LTWEPPKGDESDATVQYQYHVEYTIDDGFPEEKTTAVDWSSRKDVKELFLLLTPGVDEGVPLTVPTHNVLRAHVRTTISGEKDWSLPTPVWKVASSCDQVQEYLVDDCANCTNDLQKFYCTACPVNSHCTGNVVWKDVRAKFGNWRVFDALNAKTKVKDYVKVRETMFKPCLYPPACLGAASDKEDVRGRYWAPIEIYLKMDVTFSSMASSSGTSSGNNNASLTWIPKTKADCESLANGPRNKWDEENKICLTDMSYLNLIETCNHFLGHDVNCKDQNQTDNQTHFCRLCDRCANLHQRETGNECSKCPPAEANRGFLSLGAILILVAVGVLVYLQIKNNGQGRFTSILPKNQLSISFSYVY